MCYVLTRPTMPPRLRFVTPNPLCSRSRLTLGFSILTPKTPSRYVTADEKPLSASEQPKGPNQDQLPHVSEEAAEIGKSTGEGGPELEQGTPVQEVCLDMPLGLQNLTVRTADTKTR